MSKIYLLIISYRSWLDRIRNERPAFLTITSLELPECSVPLIDSLSSVRCRRIIDQNVSDKDEILGELLEKAREKVVEVNVERENEKCVVSDEPVKKVRKARKQGIELLACTKGPETLEECTRSIVEGPKKIRPPEEDEDCDCICSKISENLRINIRKKTEVTRSPRDPSPEVTHTIHIAMKYHGQPDCGVIDENEIKDPSTSNSEKIKKNTENQISKVVDQIKENCCSSVKFALDFTLNCNRVQLTSRDITLRTATKNQPTRRNSE